MSVALDRDAESAPQAEVSNLEAQVTIVDKQILWLQVTVQNSMLVTVSQAFDHLVHEVLKERKG